MLQPDTVLNDRYRILGPLGEGGMATVYRALDTRLGRTVAIKILHPEFARDDPFLQRFQQEAEFAASLGAHPNVVAIYDIGEDGNLPYIVMEVVEGRNLKDLIRERAPFSAEEAFAIGRQVASALDFAHSRGLVHRDVKPQNIVVTPDGVAKVTDFGIARSATASQLTRTGTVLGTVHYFSPEQAQGKPAGPPSDIYSLGVILYEMLTGHLPFDADNPIGIAMQHLHSEPPPPWQYNQALPARAVSTVLRALEKDPERRYRDAAEFAAALAAGPEPEVAGATTINRIVEAAPQRTTVYRPVEPARTTTTGPPPPTVPPRRTTAASNPPWRPVVLVLLALLFIIGAAAGAFYATGHVLGGASATATPTPTLTPTPKPKHKPTATPTAVPVVPTFTPAPALPTFTPVPPTSTPRPRPTRPPRPTATPPPVPTVVLATPTSTAVGFSRRGRSSSSASVGYGSCRTPPGWAKHHRSRLSGAPGGDCLLPPTKRR